MPHFRRAPLRALLVVSLFAACSALASCAASGQIGLSGGDDSQGGNGGGSGGGELVTGSATVGASGGALDPDAACGLITEEAKTTPLALYIMLDRSNSMNGPNWESAKAGINAFVNDAASAGIKVALNFFPLPMTPTTCDQMQYLMHPAAAFGLLPQNAAAVAGAMKGTEPDGFQTPIYPALGGAILGVKQETANHSGEAGAVLLVTDGQPEGLDTMCGSVNPQDTKVIADLAKTGTTYGIKTFVVGLYGVNQSFANQVALAGGTDTAILVSALNVEVEFQKALAKVRGQALPCTYELPKQVEDSEFDIGLVNVLLTPGGGKAAILPQNPTCEGDGWKYNDPGKPASIIFCPSSCQGLKADFAAKVQILLGCKTEVIR